MEQLKNMMAFIEIGTMVMLLRNFQVKFLFSLNPMHQVSQAEVSEIHLKPEDILHGMFHHLFLLLEQLFVYQQYLFHIQVKHSIIKPLFLKLFQNSTRQQLMFASILIKMLTKVIATLGCEQEYFLIDEALILCTVPTLCLLKEH